jgi:hypothetical protein
MPWPSVALAADQVEREQEDAEISRKMPAAIETAASSLARRSRLKSYPVAPV